MRPGIPRFPWLKAAAGVVALGLHAAVLAMVLSSPVAQVAQGQPEALDVQFVDLAPAAPAPQPAADSGTPAQAMPEPEPEPEASPEPEPAAPPPEPDQSVPVPEAPAVTDAQPLPQVAPEPAPESRPKPKSKPRPVHKPRPVQPARARPRAEPARKPKPADAAPPSLAADHASAATRSDANPAAQGQPRAVAPDQPRTVGQVDYLGKRPTPVYPRLSERRGEQGRVVLRVLISPQGGVTDVKVQRSSGHARLDEAAVQAMRQARFRPYTENGIAYPARVDIPFDFVL